MWFSQSCLFSEKNIYLKCPEMILHSLCYRNYHLKILHLVFSFGFFFCFSVHLNVTQQRRGKCLRGKCVIHNYLKTLLSSSLSPLPRSPGLYSQEGLAHGTGVAMHLPIWALDGVILSCTEKLSILPGFAVFTAQLLWNQRQKFELLNTSWIRLQKILKFRLFFSNWVQQLVNFRITLRT